MKEVINNLKVESSIEMKENKLCKSNIFIFEKDINPKKLYLYLHSMFGKPNGILSLLRNEDSDNIFYWHYTLKYKRNLIHLMCATYRLEVFLSSIITENKYDL